MNKLIFLILLPVTLLIGCEKSNEPVAQVETAPPAATPQTLPQNVIYLEDGAGVALGGELIDSGVRPIENGSVKFYYLKLDAPLDSIDQKVSTTLEAGGYTNKVVEEKEGYLKKHYYKKELPVIGVVYDADEETNQVVTQIYWQVQN